MSNFYFNTITNFAFEFVDTNRKQLEKWNINSFIKGFDTNEKVFNSYLSKIKDKVKTSSKAKQSIKKYLKASIASALFGDIGYYRIIHLEDKMLQKVLELESRSE
jgi:carboxyl-terminal processing protease